VVLPSTLVNRFFLLLKVRNLKGAKVLLSRIQSRLPRGEWNRGYYMALSGMLLSLESKNPRLFINNISDTSQYREEFLKHAQARLHADYDRGFFTAWVDFLRGSD